MTTQNSVCVCILRNKLMNDSCNTSRARDGCMNIAGLLTLSSFVCPIYFKKRQKISSFLFYIAISTFHLNFKQEHRFKSINFVLFYIFCIFIINNSIYETRSFLSMYKWITNVEIQKFSKSFSLSIIWYLIKRKSDTVTLFDYLINLILWSGMIKAKYSFSIN